MHLNSIATVLVLAARTLACGLLHGRSPGDTAPQFAPLPPTAVGLPLGPGGYAVQAFGKGAYMVTDGSYQGR